MLQTDLIKNTTSAEMCIKSVVFHEIREVVKKMIQWNWILPLSQTSRCFLYHKHLCQSVFRSHPQGGSMLLTSVVSPLVRACRP